MTEEHSMTHAMRRNGTGEGRGRIATSVAVLAALAALAVIAPGSSQGRGTVYAPGDIIVAQTGLGASPPPSERAVKAVDPVSGAATTVSSAGLLVSPADVTFASDGDTIVVDRDAFGGEGGIIRIDSETAAQTALSSNAISNAAGGKKLFKNPIALDRKGGSLYVTDFHRPQKVIKVNIDTGKQSLITEGLKLREPFGIVADGLKNPIVSDLDGGVIEVNARTGKQTVISDGGKIKYPSAIQLLNDNNVVVAGRDNQAGVVVKVNVNNGDQKRLARGGPISSPQGIALIDSHTAVVSDLSPSLVGSLYRVDLDSGEQTLLNGSDFSNPLGIDIAP
jgi:sugar lactone lactonase YvrE